MCRKKLTDLYQYFDQLVEQNSDQDTLFASSYIRGFIALEATHFGDEHQLLTKQLYCSVFEKIKQAKNELTPQDQTLVQNFYIRLNDLFFDIK